VDYHGAVRNIILFEIGFGVTYHKGYSTRSDATLSLVVLLIECTHPTANETSFPVSEPMKKA
jgi:hypothetical protein